MCPSTQKMVNIQSWLERDDVLVNNLKIMVQNEFKVTEEQAVRAIDTYRQSGRQALFAANLKTEYVFFFFFFT